MAIRHLQWHQETIWAATALKNLLAGDWGYQCLLGRQLHSKGQLGWKGWAWSIWCVFSHKAANKQRAAAMRAKSSLETTHLWKSQPDPGKQNFKSREISNSSKVKFQTCSRPESILKSLMTHLLSMTATAGVSRGLEVWKWELFSQNYCSLFSQPCSLSSSSFIPHSKAWMISY